MSTCHRCGGAKLIGGTLLADPPAVIPDGLRRWTGFNSPSVALVRRDAVRICLDCGLVWGEVAPHDVRDKVRRLGKPETLAALGMAPPRA